MKATFSEDDLKIKGDSEEESQRQLLIYETIKDRDSKNLYISEREKYFAWLFVHLANKNGFDFAELKCFENPKFKFLYLTYLEDFAGGTRYYKPSGVTFYSVQIPEVEADLEYLYKIAEEWEVVINKTNHKEELLQQISAETREEIRTLNSQPEIISDPYAKGKFNYIFKIRKILLHSKYLYCMAMEIFESTEQSDYTFELNGEVIIFNEFSLIHILNRHFAEISKQYNSGKSYHRENMKPRILSKQLKSIIENIDKSQYLKDRSIDKIAFNLHGLDYLIFTHVRIAGQKKYRRLETFFLLNEVSQLAQLKSSTQSKVINENLSVYVTII